MDGEFSLLNKYSYIFLVISARTVHKAAGSDAIISPVIDMVNDTGNYGEIVDWLLTFCDLGEMKRALLELVSICANDAQDKKFVTVQCGRKPDVLFIVQPIL